MQHRFTLLFVVLFLVIVTKTAKSQEVEESPLDTLTRSVFKLQTDLDLIKHLKITGYVQAQFQKADSAGEASFEGGNFAPYTDSRFNVRRGRLKFVYDNGPAQGVFQFDLSEKGFAIKDAYVKVTDQKWNAISLTTGIFDRPFGFEISYSSNIRETPERSRLFQTIFPGERDLGSKITYQKPKTSKWNFFKVEAGFFNGTGGAASDFDSKKDFIGNIGINKTTKDEKLNYAVRASYYNGGYRQPNKFVYDHCTEAIGFVLDSTAENKGRIARREYIGGDFQLNYQSPFGLTTLRGEYIQGTQPGTSATTTSPATDPGTDTYIRKFNGAYAYFLQNIGQSRHQFMLKYDWYDPNTSISKNEIGKVGSKTNKTDIKYTTLGIGWMFRMDTNLKFTAYYDIVKNETSSKLSGFTKDTKDNVFTLRVQFKF